VNTEKIKKLLSEISPRPWRIHLGGGHKAASIIGAESIHTKRMFVDVAKETLDTFTFNKIKEEVKKRIL
jgi:hypothetical protein